MHTRNRTLTRALPDKTPYEAWCGHKPNARLLRAFGTKAFIRLEHHQRHKLDAVAKARVFLGYTDGVKGYRLYDPETRRLVTSHSVAFREDETMPVQWPEQRVQAEEGGGEQIVLLVFPSASVQDEAAVPGRSGPAEVVPQVERGAAQSAEQLERAEDAAESSSEDERTEDEPGQPPPTPPKPVGMRRVAPVQQPRIAELASRFQAPETALRRSTRERHPPKPFWVVPKPAEDEPEACAAAVQPAEPVLSPEIKPLPLPPPPTSVREAKERAEWPEWLQAMQEEMTSIQSQSTWTLVQPPGGNRHALGCKWVYTYKTDAEGRIVRYKARLVVKGFGQRHGIDYNETFSSTIRAKSVRAMLAVSAVADLELHHVDVCTAFLNGRLEEEVYMEQPPEFSDPLHPDLVCKLNRTLYGLKQSPRKWYKEIKRTFEAMGFKRAQYDHSIFVKWTADGPVLVGVYVDDMLVASKLLDAIAAFKEELATHYKIKDLGEVTKILGMEVRRNRATKQLFLGQEAYAREVLAAYNMQDATPKPAPLALGVKLVADALDDPELHPDVPYCAAIGSLMYLMVGTRPDLLYAVSLVSRFLAKPRQSHWNAVKQILAYVAGTTDTGLVYGSPGATLELIGYADADWASDKDLRWLVTGIVMTLGGGAVS